MSGHSHWAGIKHKKGAADAKRGKLFSRLARNIIGAAREGGGDVSMNLKLRYAIDKAREANMPKDNIARAIKKGTGELAGAQALEEITYEGYGPSGVAIMAEVLTDNRSRTGPEVRKIFETRGGNLGGAGCVSWMFSPKGFFVIAASLVSEDRVMELAVDAGADDLARNGDSFEITCLPEAFSAVQAALEAAEIACEAAEITKIPSTYVDLDSAVGRKVLGLLEALEDHEDVQNVYANFNLPDEVSD